MISDLVHAGAHVNTQDKWQHIPLHMAAYEGHLQAVATLILAGASINAKNKNKRTPLDLAKPRGITMWLICS